MSRISPRIAKYPPEYAIKYPKYPEYRPKYPEYSPIKPEYSPNIARLDLISLNKYVVTLIINKANSCLTYNSVAGTLFFDLRLPLPFIEKILLSPEPRYNWCRDSITELFFQKFVLSSIIRCLKIQPYHSFLEFKVSLFSLKVLFHS